jgi:acetolactate synthase-1/2/3 large subunit
MKGAHALLRALAASGVDTCFMNPGTSEMHFVAALDSVPEVKGVLALFEGVATGAADGYARIARRPAAVLLHLGPGLGNGIANLHNARRARSPVVNVVGDHASYHKRYDAPLESDIEGLARPVSKWLRRCYDVAGLGLDACEACVAASSLPQGVATLILPADLTWADGAELSFGPRVHRGPGVASAERIEAAAKALTSGAPAALYLGAPCLGERLLRTAAEVAAATGADVLAPTFPARLARRPGLLSPRRLPYLGELAASVLAQYRFIVRVQGDLPVSFFAYPGKPSTLLPDDCEVVSLAEDWEDPEASLELLAEAVGRQRPQGTPGAPAEKPVSPEGALTPEKLALTTAAVLPEDAIVSDEANTAGLHLYDALGAAPPHDLLCLTGGAIGQGIPVATGAAVAGGGRPVLCLEADGSAMYTIQGLWTQAREGLPVVTVVLSNRSYAVLQMELQRVGAEGRGTAAQAMLEIDSPEIDFVSLAKGLGVPAERVEDCGGYAGALQRGFTSGGPYLIEAVLPKGLSL